MPAFTDMSKVLPRPCKECGSIFAPNAHNQIFCATICLNNNKKRGDKRYFCRSRGERRRAQARMKDWRKCLRCNQSYKPVRVKQEFCSPSCRRLGYAKPINGHYIDEAINPDGTLIQILDLSDATDAHMKAVAAEQLAHTKQAAANADFIWMERFIRGQEPNGTAAEYELRLNRHAKGEY